MSGYDYALHRSGLDSFQALTLSEQRVLIGAFERIAASPFLRGDFSYRDAEGRANQVLDLGGVVVTYWVDHAAKEVRILAVERV